jgi:ribosomal-protein-alanine N-acetyltransferase
MITTEQIICLAQPFHLATERLTLRRFTSADLESEMKQQQDPEVVRYIREPLSDEEAVIHFGESLKPYKGEESEWLGICVSRSKDNQNIGAIAFRIYILEPGVVEIGYRFDANYQGKGYATESVKALIDFLFKQVQAHKVVAFCDPRNEASFKLMEKLGMQREGYLREQYRVGETWTDELAYGLLESEWR